MRPSLVVPAVLALALALSACGSSNEHGPSGGGNGGAAAAGTRDVVREGPAEEEIDPDRPRVTLGAESTAALQDFVNRPGVLLGDRVKVDMSRKPFLAATTFSLSKEDVRRTERIDGERGVLIITLENISGQRALAETSPRVRFGDGLEVAALDSLELRYWSEQEPDRPIFFLGVAAGNALFVSEDADGARERHEGTTVRLWAETRKEGEEFRFDRGAEARR